MNRQLYRQRDNVHDRRTVDQKGNSRLDPNWTVSLSFHACLENENRNVWAFVVVNRVSGICMFSSFYGVPVVSIHFNFVTQQNSTCKGLFGDGHYLLLSCIILWPCQPISLDFGVDHKKVSLDVFPVSPRAKEWFTKWTRQDTCAIEVGRKYILNFCLSPKVLTKH